MSDALIEQLAEAALKVTNNATTPDGIVLRKQFKEAFEKLLSKRNEGYRKIANSPAAQELGFQDIFNAVIEKHMPALQAAEKAPSATVDFKVVMCAGPKTLARLGKALMYCRAHVTAYSHPTPDAADTMIVRVERIYVEQLKQHLKPDQYVTLKELTEKCKCCGGTGQDSWDCTCMNCLGSEKQ